MVSNEKVDSHIHKVYQGSKQRVRACVIIKCFLDLKGYEQHS